MNERLHFLEERLSAAISTIQQQNLQKQMQMRIYPQPMPQIFQQPMQPKIAPAQTLPNQTRN